MIAVMSLKVGAMGLIRGLDDLTFCIRKKKETAEKCDEALLKAQDALQTLREALKKIQYHAPEFCLDDSASMQLETKQAYDNEHKARTTSRLDDYVFLIKLANQWNRTDDDLRKLVGAFDDKRAPKETKQIVDALRDIFEPLTDPDKGINRSERYIWNIQDSNTFLYIPTLEWRSIAYWRESEPAERQFANEIAGDFVNDKTSQAIKNINRLLLAAKQLTPQG